MAKKYSDKNPYLGVQILADSLRVNLRHLKFWQLKRNFMIRKISQVKYLIDNLCDNEISQYINDVLTLEENEFNKKKVAPQSDGMSPKA